MFTFLILFLQAGSLYLAPPVPESIEYELSSGGEKVGTFVANISEGQEGMLKFDFRGRIGESSTKGEVTTIPRLLHRYARLAIEAEAGSDFVSLTLLSPAAVEVVKAVGSGRQPEGFRRIDATEIAGVEGQVFVPENEGDTGPNLIVASPDYHLPLRVRTRQDASTVIEIVATAARTE